jgi:hypothetical protein
VLTAALCGARGEWSRERVGPRVRLKFGSLNKLYGVKAQKTAGSV